MSAAAALLLNGLVKSPLQQRLPVQAALLWFTPLAPKRCASVYSSSWPIRSTSTPATTTTTSTTQICRGSSFDEDNYPHRFSATTSVIDLREPEPTSTKTTTSFKTLPRQESGIGSDKEMIAANHRMNGGRRVMDKIMHTATTSSTGGSQTAPGSLGLTPTEDDVSLPSWKRNPLARCPTYSVSNAAAITDPISWPGPATNTKFTATSRYYSTIRSTTKLFSSAPTPALDVAKTAEEDGASPASASGATPLTVSDKCAVHGQTNHAATTSTTFPAAMKDEYGVMDDAGHTYVYPGDFVLESGGVLPYAQLRYQTYGKLNAATRDNVVVVCHALTGNASLHSWWGDLLGPGRAFDTDKYFVVCCNILGSCYGSTGPTSIHPTTQRPYGKDFPDVSVKDTVRLQLLMLQNDLQIRSIQAVIGGSFGGMQAMEFAAQAGSSTAGSFFDQSADPAGTESTKTKTPYMRCVIPIACGAAHTAWQIGVSEVQRQAIYKDPHWESAHPEQATAGLEVARQLGMITYRTALGFQGKFGRAKQSAASPPYGSHAHWQVKSYLEYQGTKFLDRFDPVTYVKMTEQMDSHDLARGRVGDDTNTSTEQALRDVLATIDIPALVMGIDSDVLYPLYEQEFLAQHLPQGRLEVIHSADGHDGFLLEQEQVGRHIRDFLAKFDAPCS